MIILSLPYKENWQNIRKINDPDCITGLTELRFDLSDTNLSDINEIFDESTILTVRGNIPGKKKFLEYHAVHSKCKFDLDYSIMRNYNLPRERVIISYHDFSLTPDVEKLKTFLNEFSQEDSFSLKAAINIGDFATLKEIQSIIDDYDRSLIFVGMGKLGKLTRILYRQMNSRAVYTGIKGQETAEGQISIQELYKYYPVNEDTAIGGIIGGEQIVNSLGIEFYNQEFRLRNMNARYLPFIIDNPRDFFNWIEYSKTRTKFYGFSITMPAKKTIPQLFSCNKISNLMLWQERIFLNTDLDAFHEIKRLIGELPHLPILIYGTGASADNAVSVLSGKRLYVYGRNKKHTENFADKHSIDLFKEGCLHSYIMINCTPVKPEILLEDFPEMKYLVNLSYPTGNVEDKRLIFTGEDFWRCQAERQLQEFLKEIKGL